MIKCSYGAGRSTENCRLCVEEAVKNFNEPKLIFFFSGEDEFCEYARIIHEMFPDCVTIGASAYSVWAADGVDKNVLKALAVSDGIEVSAGVIPKADSFALAYADNVRNCVKSLKSTENTVCVEFVVPFRRMEEYALMALNSVLLKYDIPVIGGSAGTEDMTKTGYVALNGEIYPDGCVFAVIRNLNGAVKLYRENIYEPLTGKQFIATKANSEMRTVMQCDNITAAEAYAKELGVPASEADKYFFNYPVGRQVGDDYYVTAVHEVGVNGSLIHLTRIHEGTAICVMKEGDYRKITADTINKIRRETPEPSLVLLINCVARNMLFEQSGYVEDYSRMLSEAFPNYIGASCFGEQLGTRNFNHTLMVAVFE